MDRAARGLQSERGHLRVGQPAKENKPSRTTSSVHFTHVFTFLMFHQYLQVEQGHMMQKKTTKENSPRQAGNIVLVPLLPTESSVFPTEHTQPSAGWTGDEENKE